MQPWVTSPSFTVPPVSPWQKAPVADDPAYQNDENLKKAFGVELAKTSNPLDAAGKLAGDDITKALWISFNWMNDPIVIASRDIYLKTLETSSPPLDKEQLAARVLALAEEKILSPKFGCVVPTIEAKDRIAAYKLYSDILGYTGKTDINNSINNNFTHNKMEIKLVETASKDERVIEHAPNVKSEIVNENALPITLKLVGAR